MRKLFLFSALLAATPLNAAETKVMAANGVSVSVNGDDFAGRYEYVAPSIDISGGGVNGAFFIAAIKKGSTPAMDSYQGFVMYSGEWRFYKSAVFRGGDPVKYTRTDGKVGSCRYGCTLTENFLIELTPAEITKYAVNGIVEIQVRAQNTQTFMLSIPVRYIDAVNEVKKR